MILKIDNLDNQTRSQLIDFAINNHKNSKKIRAEKLLNYYKADHQEIQLKTADEYKPNNKEVHNFPSLIINTVQGYMLGQPVKYTSENSNGLESVQDIYDNNEEEDLNSELFKTMSITGEAYEYVYINQEKEVELIELPILETVAIYDNSLKAKMLAVVRYYDSVDLATGNTKTCVEVYTASSIEYYSKGNSNEYTLEDEYQHTFAEVPVIHYMNNKELTGDFEKVLTLIDSLDKISSEDADEIEYLANAYLVINGFGKIDEPTLKKFRKQGAFVNPNGNNNGGVQNPIQFVNKNLNTDAVHKHADLLIESIHKFSQIPNFLDPNAGIASSGVAIKQRTWGFEQLAATKERKFKHGLMQRLRLVLRAISMLGGSQYDSAEFTLKFSRNLPNNNLEDAQILNTLGITATQLSEEALRDVVSSVTIIEDAQEAAGFMVKANKDMTSKPVQEPTSQLETKESLEI